MHDGGYDMSAVKKDVFICHSKEDKKAIIYPLLSKFEKANISCWVDEAEIKWGDSITEKVNEGIRTSRFVIVVISPSFMSKNWPWRELNALLNIEASKKEVKILPLLVKETIFNEVIEKIPLINDKEYLCWDNNPDKILEKLLDRLSVFSKDDQNDKQVIFKNKEKIKENERIQSHSRRDFIKVLALIGCSGMAGQLMTAFNPFKKIYSFYNDSKVDLIRKLFYLGEKSEIQFAGGLFHLYDDYKLSNYLLSSTYLAATSLRDGLALHSEDWFKKLHVSEKIPSNLSKGTDILTIGCPISDLVSREALEYSGSQYHLKRNKNPKLILPIEYVLDKDDVGSEHFMCKRFVTGMEKQMPNWTISIDGNQFPPPRTDRDGWLQSDYLLITRMPNVLSPVAFYSGKEILIIGGTHGIGTEAINLILNNEEYLEEIYRQTKSYKYYQILVEVDKVKHYFDKPKHFYHSKPISLKLPPVVREVKTRNLNKTFV